MLYRHSDSGLFCSIHTGTESSFFPSHCGTAGVQLLKVERAGTGAEKALLAEVKAKNPDATPPELLRLFHVRR